MEQAEEIPFISIPTRDIDDGDEDKEIEGEESKFQPVHDPRGGLAHWHDCLRRIRISTIALLVLGACLLTVLISALIVVIQAKAQSSQLSSTPPFRALRLSDSLNRGWRYARVDVPGAESEDFEESGVWRGVDLPHSWNRLDGEDGNDDYYRGVAWYRRELFIAPEMHSRQVFLRFNGSNRVTDVYFNGHHLGQNRGGFNAFQFDATAFLRPEVNLPNLLAVRVNNSYDPDIAPLSGDFTFFGGLYRGVELVAVNQVHLAMQDYGGPGLYATPRNVTERESSLDVLARVENDGKDSVEVSVRFTLTDMEGRVVKQFNSPSQTIPAHGKAELKQSTTVERPHLWNGRDDPYLYQIHAEVVVNGGEITDHVAQPVGFRWFNVDSEKGFFLNGRPYELHGVNMHQDREHKGWAISDQDREEDVSIVLELGITGLRLAHYQHDQHTYDLADRAGLCVWAEIPVVKFITEDIAFTSNAIEQLRSLIRQNYNHPSIFFWSISNEPRLEFEGHPMNSDPLLATLNKVAHEEDDTRLTTMAHCCRPEDDPVVEHTDVHGYNKYFGWYRPVLEDVGPWLDEIHHNHSEYRFAMSEYGAGASIHHHGYDGNKRPEFLKLYHPEAWQAIVHEHHWAVLKARPHIWGKFVWNAFDFAIDLRNEGDRAGRNDKGLVTYDRGVRKDAYWFYKAQWSKEAFVYINNRRFVHRHLRKNEVKVYLGKGIESVVVRVNDNEVATSDVPSNRTIVFWDVELSPGENTIRVEGRSDAGETIASDEVKWHYRPEIRLNAGARTTNNSADGIFWDMDHYVIGSKSKWEEIPPGRLRTFNASDFTAPSLVYQTYRFGPEFEYQVPVDSGFYDLKLHLLEPQEDLNIGMRPMDVYVQGQLVFPNIDIRRSSAAGILSLTYQVNAASGMVDVRLKSLGKMPAVLSGLEIISVEKK
ncbi:uncharacterized protein VTP21DRAFT_4115 [Calcarisporiella thermophila]|uniref:uncharacterized protein n=1 Tax=Calcarisporiella thermophila TaxID=911321 RepID=UPI0037431648